jgi:hypothetical protein
MYIVTVVLFLIPGSIILVAWIGAIRYRHESVVQNWRDHCVTGALIVGSCAIPMGMAENLAWLHVGGNPHGMRAPIGMWIPLRRVFLSAIIVSASLAILGKGKGRFMTLAAVIAAFASDFIVGLLDME